ncbi:MAG: hypothetical protein PVI23_09405 [Maricaulaceae bacterium]
MRAFAAIAISTVLAGHAAAAEPLSADGALAERAGALALDDRCAVLTPEQRAALRSGIALARNSLLRGGWGELNVANMRFAAEAQAAALPCEAEDAAEIFAGVTSGFEGWSRLPAMVYPGDHRSWSARRPTVDRGWSLIQDISRRDDERAWFGLAVGPDGVGRPALALAGDARAGVVRLRMRDFTLSETMIDPEIRRFAAGASDLHPLAAAAAPEVYTRVVWAYQRNQYPRDDWYADGFGGEVEVFWFSEDLIGEIARLDPREALRIEVQYGPRSAEPGPVDYFVEIGDFTPAYFFLSAKSPAFPPLEPPEPPREVVASDALPTLR